MPFGSHNLEGHSLYCQPNCDRLLIHYSSKFRRPKFLGTVKSERPNAYRILLADLIGARVNRAVSAHFWNLIWGHGI